MLKSNYYIINVNNQSTHTYFILPIIYIHLYGCKKYILFNCFLQLNQTYKSRFIFQSKINVYDFK